MFLATTFHSTTSFAQYFPQAKIFLEKFSTNFYILTWTVSLLASFVLKRIDQIFGDWENPFPDCDPASREWVD